MRPCITSHLRDQTPSKNKKNNPSHSFSCFSCFVSLIAFSNPSENPSHPFPRLESHPAGCLHEPTRLYEKGPTAARTLPIRSSSSQLLVLFDNRGRGTRNNIKKCKWCDKNTSIPCQKNVSACLGHNFGPNDPCLFLSHLGGSLGRKSAGATSETNSDRFTKATKGLQCD